MIVRILLVLFCILPAFSAVRTTFSDGSQPINVGEIDPSFSITSQPNGRINDIYPLPDGRIVVGGEFTKCGEIDQAYLAIFLPDGSLDKSFSPVLNGKVNAIAFSELPNPEFFPNDGLFIGGAFTEVNGAPQGGFAILNPDGSNFEFGLSPGFDGEVNAIIAPSIYQESYLLIGGAFSSFNGAPAQNLVAMYPDFSFGGQGARITNNEVDGPVYTIEDHDPSGLYRTGFFIGGEFTTIQGQPFLNVAYVDDYGQPYGGGLSFLELNGPVHEIVLTDSRFSGLVLRGDFTSYGNDTAPGIAFLRPSQSIWQATPVTLPDSKVTSFARENLTQIRLGHLDGSVSHLCGSMGENQIPTWTVSPHFSNNGPVLDSAVTSGRADEFSLPRIGFNSFHGSATGQLVKVLGLHGSTPPPAPSPEFVVRNDQIQSILPQGLSILEQQCEISSDNGHSWQTLDPRQNFLYKGLFPNHPYQLRARYRNSNGFGPFSSTIKFDSPIFTPTEGSRTPIKMKSDISLGAVWRIAPGANDGILVHGDITGVHDSIPFSYSGALSLFDSNLRLVAIHSGFDPTDRNTNSFTSLSDGSVLYLDWKLGNGHSWNEVIKLRPDLSIDNSFPSIKLNRYAAFIAPVGMEGEFTTAEITDSDPQTLRLTHFASTGEIQSPPLVFDFSGNISQLVALPSGEFLIDGYFENLPNFIGQIFTRIYISSDGSYSPIQLSSLGNFQEWSPLRHIATDGSQYYQKYTINHPPSSGAVITLSKTDIQGNELDGFSAELKEVRYGRPGQLWLTPTTNNKLIVSGQFSHCNGIPFPGIVRLNADGSIDRKFEPALDLAFGFGLLQNGIAPLSDGSLIYPSRSNQRQNTQLIKLRGDTTPDNRILWASAHGFQSFIATADPDKDGLTQQIELLYGLDPNLPDSFQPLSFINNNGSITAQVMPPLFPFGLPEFELSTDLKSWRPIPLRPDFTVETNHSRSFLRLGHHN